MSLGPTPNNQPLKKSDDGPADNADAASPLPNQTSILPIPVEISFGSTCIKVDLHPAAVPYVPSSAHASNAFATLDLYRDLPGLLDRWRSDPTDKLNGSRNICGMFSAVCNTMREAEMLALKTIESLPSLLLSSPDDQLALRASINWWREESIEFLDARYRRELPLCDIIFAQLAHRLAVAAELGIFQPENNDQLSRDVMLDEIAQLANAHEYFARKQTSSPAALPLNERLITLAISNPIIAVPVSAANSVVAESRERNQQSIERTRMLRTSLAANLEMNAHNSLWSGVKADHSSAPSPSEQRILTLGQYLKSLREAPAWSEPFNAASEIFAEHLPTSIVFDRDIFRSHDRGFAVLETLIQTAASSGIKSLSLDLRAWARLTWPPGSPASNIDNSPENLIRKLEEYRSAPAIESFRDSIAAQPVSWNKNEGRFFDLVELCDKLSRELSLDLQTGPQKRGAPDDPAARILEIIPLSRRVNMLADVVANALPHRRREIAIIDSLSSVDAVDAWSFTRGWVDARGVRVADARIAVPEFTVGIVAKTLADIFVRHAQAKGGAPAKMPSSDLLLMIEPAEQL